MATVTLRPLTAEEFEALKVTLCKGYAADKVRAGEWAPVGAEARAADQLAHLLPQGLRTPDVLLAAAETPDGEWVGRLWLGWESRGPVRAAWIYDIEVSAAHRGSGYGRALLSAAEEAAHQGGATEIGLQVFGHNPTARHLYESAGYEVTAQQMRKSLP
jgi:ribosomal protein S18 acetylase RimI-like enzyme